MAKKERNQVPTETAARIQFLSNRTCCVCRIAKKPIQIHHIDEDPANNVISNLCVLCFDCHRETQIKGGFDRKLDSHQLLMFRDDWHRIISEQRRANNATFEIEFPIEDTTTEEATSLAEIYRENGDWESLAIHYHMVGNIDLRDKYIELAVKFTTWDQSVWYLRGLQNRIDLIPEDLIQRELAKLSQRPDFTQRARLFNTLGRKTEAILDYVRGIQELLQSKNWFSAAFYLKEMVNSELIAALFIKSLNEFSSRGELWWQVRALQELGCDQKISDLVSNNKAAIDKENFLPLLEIAAKYGGNRRKAFELKKKHAQQGYGPGLFFPCNQSEKAAK